MARQDIGFEAPASRVNASFSGLTASNPFYNAQKSLTSIRDSRRQERIDAQTQKNRDRAFNEQQKMNALKDKQFEEQQRMNTLREERIKSQIARANEARANELKIKALAQAESDRNTEFQKLYLSGNRQLNDFNNIYDNSDDGSKQAITADNATRLASIRQGLEAKAKAEGKTLEQVTGETAQSMGNAGITGSALTDIGDAYALKTDAEIQDKLARYNLADNALSNTYDSFVANPNSKESEADYYARKALASGSKQALEQAVKLKQQEELSAQYPQGVIRKGTPRSSGKTSSRYGLPKGIKLPTAKELTSGNTFAQELSKMQSKNETINSLIASGNTGGISSLNRTVASLKKKGYSPAQIDMITTAAITPLDEGTLGFGASPVGFNDKKASQISNSIKADNVNYDITPGEARNRSNKLLRAMAGVASPLAQSRVNNGSLYSNSISGIDDALKSFIPKSNTGYTKAATTDGKTPELTTAQKILNEKSKRDATLNLIQDKGVDGKAVFDEARANKYGFKDLEDDAIVGAIADKYDLQSNTSKLVTNLLSGFTADNGRGPSLSSRGYAALAKVARSVGVNPSSIRELQVWQARLSDPNSKRAVQSLIDQQAPTRLEQPEAAKVDEELRRKQLYQAGELAFSGATAGLPALSLGKKLAIGSKSLPGLSKSVDTMAKLATSASKGNGGKITQASAKKIRALKPTLAKLRKRIESFDKSEVGSKEYNRVKNLFNKNFNKMENLTYGYKTKL